MASTSSSRGESDTEGSGGESSRSAEESEPSDEPKGKISKYEKQRFSRIAENKARLEALGVSKAAKALQSPSLNSRKRRGKRNTGEEDDDDDYRPSEADGDEDDDKEETDDNEDEEFLGISTSASRKRKVGKSGEISPKREPLIKENHIPENYFVVAAILPDDGSGIALKSLSRVKKGWGQGDISSFQPLRVDYLDYWEDDG